MSPFLPLFLFYFMMFFFPCMPQFLQALWFFFIVPSLLSQGFSLSLHPTSVFFFTFITPQFPSVIPPSIFTDCPPNPPSPVSLSSSLQPLPFLHLKPFDQEPVCSFPFPPLLLLLLVLHRFLLQLVKNSVHTRLL